MFLVWTFSFKIEKPKYFGCGKGQEKLVELRTMCWIKNWQQWDNGGGQSQKKERLHQEGQRGEAGFSSEWEEKESSSFWLQVNYLKGAGFKPAV